MIKTTSTLCILFFSLILNAQTSWNEISLPPTSPSNGQLFEIKVISPNLIFSAGSRIDPNGSSLGLILKYDGTSWVEMDSPNTIIKSIAPINENDIYALSGNSVFHWDGSSWTDISSTLPDYNANPNFDMRVLFKMIAFASDDIWVIGKILNTSSGQGDLETYAVHFDGSSWSVATIPQSNKIDNVGAGLVMEVDATGPNDIWIATRGYIENNGLAQLGIWHFDGINWAFVGEIVSAAGNVFLRDVSAGSPNDVWFAGYYSPGQGTLAAFYAHYDGSNYTYTDQPLTVTDYQRYCIVALDDNNVWSGHQSNGTDFTFFDGASWTSQSTIITSTTGGGIRDIKRVNDCLWAVGFSTVNGTKPMLLETCTSILNIDEEQFKPNSFKLYPNPAFETLHIEFGNKFARNDLNVKIYNFIGQAILESTITDTSISHQINIENLNKGIYFIKIEGLGVRKFIKR